MPLQCIKEPRGGGSALARQGITQDNAYDGMHTWGCFDLTQQIARGSANSLA